jgi:nicotinamide-nucleotide amidase
VVRDADTARATARADALEAEVRRRLGHHIYGDGTDSFPAAVGRVLRARQATIALAESCTGGLLGHWITGVPGSSAYLLMGLVVYSNAAKQQLLAVPSELLAEHGAVSEACVRVMAEAVRERAGSTLGVAISGIAGPDGGTPDKPVGTVHLAVAGPRGTHHRHRVWPARNASAEERDQIKQVAAHAALAMIYRYWED